MAEPKMITKALYLYWTNSGYLYKPEKFFLYLLVMAITSVGFGVLTFNGLLIFVPALLLPQVWFISLCVVACTVVYWILRWCYHLKLEATNKMDAKGKRLDKEEYKVRTKELELKERELALRERELALGFAKDLR
mgnify:CR=1 FL=1|jgi:hypothetical protein